MEQITCLNGHHYFKALEACLLNEQRNYCNTSIEHLFSNLIKIRRFKFPEHLRHFRPRSSNSGEFIFVLKYVGALDAL